MKERALARKGVGVIGFEESGNIYMRVYWLKLSCFVKAHFWKIYVIFWHNVYDADVFSQQGNGCEQRDSKHVKF